MTVETSKQQVGVDDGLHGLGQRSHDYLGGPQPGLFGPEGFSLGLAVGPAGGVLGGGLLTPLAGADVGSDDTAGDLFCAVVDQLLPTTLPRHVQPLARCAASVDRE
jgi:hypothetical protein